MQRQRRMLGVSGVSRPQPGHHGLHGHVGKPECRSCKDISDAGIHFGIVAPVRRHQTHHCIFSQDPGQVVVPCQNLEHEKLQFNELGMLAEADVNGTPVGASLVPDGWLP